MPRGYLLHSRPYRESSLIATFLTDTDGRLDMVVRAVRRKAKGTAGQPLPFALYELEWSGKSELKNLRYFERAAEPVALANTALYCAFYLNELLHRLLPLHAPEPQLLDSYRFTLGQLSAGVCVESVLRHFELELLQCLGYGLELQRDEAGKPLDEGGRYGFRVGSGLQQYNGVVPADVPAGLGVDFLAMAVRDFSRIDTRHLAKQVLRAALAPHLGSRPLHSRELFRR